MTKKQACKLLGISQSAGPAKAEKAYRKKHTELSLKLRPGNPKDVRQKTQVDIANLMMAMQTFQTTVPAQSPARKPLPGRAPTAKSATKPKRTKAQSRPKAGKTWTKTANNYQTPETLADAWGTFVQMSQLPEKVVLILLGLMGFIVLIALLTNL